MQIANTNKESQIWAALADVKDPEIPVISVVDLGIITKVACKGDKTAIITMTPTFTACPAIQLMQQEIKESIEQLAIVESVIVNIDFAIPWNSDRISEKGKEQIKTFGLAPPPRHEGNIDLEKIRNTHCPNCGSEETTIKTLFGPTLCRSMHYCYDCKQGFEAFKPV